MIAKYNGNYYYYIFNKRVSNIITNQQNKVSDDFFFEDGTFYKKVAFDELEEVFDVKYIVSYNAGVENVSTEWEIANSARDVQDNCVLLRYSNGIIPGWKTEEKNVCIKYVDIRDISNAREICIYKRKDNDTLEYPKTDERKINASELISRMSSFRRDII